MYFVHLVRGIFSTVMVTLLDHVLVRHTLCGLKKEGSYYYFMLPLKYLEPNYKHSLKSNERLLCSFIVRSLYCWYYAFSLYNEWIDLNDILSIMRSSQNVQELSFNENVTNITTPRGSRYIENVIALITNW